MTTVDISVENNKVASFHYRLVDNANQEVLDESREPLEFVVGKENIVPGLEKELLGLSTGDEKDVIVSPEGGYGEYDDSKVEEVPKDQFAQLDLKEGMTVYAHDENKQTRPVIVKSFNDKIVMIDHNHPLAGKTLKFFITIAGIREATAEELESGFPAKPEASSGCCGGGCGCD